MSAWAIKLKNEEWLGRSASGGAFVALALGMMERNGVVFGAAPVGAHGLPVHISASNAEELKMLQGSIYAQSDCRNAFVECASMLNAGRDVLFSGTPCQVDALRSYLNCRAIDCGGLLTCEVICHGIPSRRLYIEYIDWLEHKLGADSGSGRMAFRDKRFGWGHNFSFSYSRKGQAHTKWGSAGHSSYYKAFLEGVTFRDSCYACPYANPERNADFTMGDFWGIESVHPECSAKGGVSALLINSATAEDFFEGYCAQYCYCTATTFEKIASGNVNLRKPTEITREGWLLRNNIYELMEAGESDRLFGELLFVHKGAKGLLRRAIPARLLLEYKKRKQK